MDKKLKNKIESREETITSLLRRLEGTVGGAQKKLFSELQEFFLDRLDRDEKGVITSSLSNRRLLENFDNIFNKFSASTGNEIALQIAKGANSVLAVNQSYYSLFAKGETQLNQISKGVNETMRKWLGITKDGKAAKNGYLDTIIKNPTIKNQIKDFSLRAIVGQQGWMQTRDELRVFIGGNREKTGVLERYYRNYVYDTYSHLDRAVSEQYGNDLGLNFAIYEGGLIEASRTFCKDRNGLVFHRSEIAEFKPTKAIPPNYNPFLDLGGYGCRHHLNWIPDSLAVMMRPNAKKFIKDGGDEPKPEPKKEEQPKQDPTPKAESEVKPAESAIKAFKGNIKETMRAIQAKINEAQSLSDFRGIISKDIYPNTEDVSISRNLSTTRLRELTSKLAELVTEYQTTAPKIGKVVFKSSDRYYGRVSYFLGETKIEEINFGDRTDIPENRMRYSEGHLNLARGKSAVEPENIHLATLVHEFAHTIWGTSRQRYLGLEEFGAKIGNLKNQYMQETNEYLGKIRAVKNQMIGKEDKEYAKLAKEKQKLENELGEFYLGSYASTNTNEFHAEAWTEYKLSNKPSRYAKAVGELMDEYFKK